MQLRSRQLAGSIRTAALLASCITLVAMTTGLLLAIHLLTETEHGGPHDSRGCAVCQNLLVVSKKLSLAPGIDLICDPPALPADTPTSVENVETCFLLISRPRGPPCAPGRQSI